MLDAARAPTLVCGIVRKRPRFCGTNVDPSPVILDLYSAGNRILHQRSVKGTSTLCVEIEIESGECTPGLSSRNTLLLKVGEKEVAPDAR